MNATEYDILSRQKSVKLTSSKPIASWNYNLKKKNEQNGRMTRKTAMDFFSFRDQIETFLHIDFAIDFIGNIFSYCSVWCAPIVAWILMAYDILWNDWKKISTAAKQNETKRKRICFWFDAIVWLRKK